jgi:hypothetical protein
MQTDDSCTRIIIRGAQWGATPGALLAACVRAGHPRREAVAAMDNLAEAGVLVSKPLREAGVQVPYLFAVTPQREMRF